MNRRVILWAGLAGIGLCATGFAAWLMTLPAAPVATIQPPIAEQERAATLAALKPPRKWPQKLSGRARPLIVTIGINDGTETNDYLMPYGILRRAGIADVVSLATGPGPVTLFPALTVMADATVAQFDARHPEGADYVIVPQMRRQDDPTVLAWLKAQSAKGAIVIGVCAGALIVANAGLLDGKRATTHWYYLDRLRREHPAIRYAADRRLVVDGNVATTTGITAAMPMMLTLIEAIAGRGKAEEVARGLGLNAWDARHDSQAFRFHRAFALTAMNNRLAFWRHEALGLRLSPDMDEVSLALVADAWSRTYRSRALTFAAGDEPVRSRNGVRIIPDQVAAAWPADKRLPGFAEKPPAQALDDALAAIASRHGRATANFVAMQLEYPR
jgi:transcriptional regulator GlxA family with amidase domain